MALNRIETLMDTKTNIIKLMGTSPVKVDLVQTSHSPNVMHLEATEQTQKPQSLY